MPRPKKPLNILMDEQIYQKLEKYLEESGQTKTAAVERILGASLDKYFEKPEEERKPY